VRAWRGQKAARHGKRARSGDADYEMLMALGEVQQSDDEMEAAGAGAEETLAPQGAATDPQRTHSGPTTGAAAEWMLDTGYDTYLSRCHSPYLASYRYIIYTPRRQPHTQQARVLTTTFVGPVLPGRQRVAER
jgi:hypothetical protein